MKKLILTIGIAVTSFAAVQAQDQAKETKQMIEGENIEKIEKSELPKEVHEGLENSDYKGAEVADAYVLSGAALDKQLGDQSSEFYIGDQYPEKIYQLHVSHDNEQSVLYFTKEGELYASREIDM